MSYNIILKLLYSNYYITILYFIPEYIIFRWKRTTALHYRDEFPLFLIISLIYNLLTFPIVFGFKLIWV